MEKRNEIILGVVAIVGVMVLIVDVLLAKQTGLRVLSASLPYLFLSIALSLLTLVRYRLKRMSDEEKRDAALARKERVDSALFESDEAIDPFTVGRTFQQFEKYFIPVVALLLAFAQGVWAWRLYERFQKIAAEPHNALLAGAMLAGQAFILFLFSRYLMALSRQPENRLLRGSGVALGLSCWAAFLSAIAAIVVEIAWSPADRVIAGFLIVFLAILAMENIVNFFLALYSPRRLNAMAVAYESRLGGLFTDPAGWTRNMAQALDYQFGFNVSESWSFRFVQNALLPLVTAQLLILYSMSAFVFIGPDEEGILERFGKPVAERPLLTSGTHVKWPWPFQTVKKFPAKKILTEYVGFAYETNAHRARVIVWTVPHYDQEDLFVVASKPHEQETGSASGSVPVNLITLNIPIEYRITNLYDYAYNFSNPSRLFRHLAYNAVTKEIANRDLFDLMNTSRSLIEQQLKKTLQQKAAELGLGIEVLFVGLQGIHPPVAVAGAFQNVVGAVEEREAFILKAKAYANTTLPFALANTARIKSEAEAYKVRRLNMASAEANLFEKRLNAFHNSPEVFKKRMYLDTLQSTLAGIRKYIVDAPPSREVIYFNFEEQAYPDLFDLGAPLEEGP